MKSCALLVVFTMLASAVIVPMAKAQVPAAKNNPGSPVSPPAASTPPVALAPDVSPAAASPPTKGLHFADAPDAAFKVVMNMAQSLHPGLISSGFLNGLDLPAETIVTIEPPMADFNTSDRTGNTPANAFPTGNLDADTIFHQYYYPIAADGREAGSVNIQRSPTSGDFMVMSWGNNPRQTVLDATKKLANLGPVQAGSFEARLLHIDDGTWGGKTTIWLKSAVAGGDLIYEILESRVPNQLTGGAGSLYTAADFIAKVSGAKTSVSPLLIVAPTSQTYPAPSTTPTPAPAAPATTMSATVVSTVPPPPGATTISGLFEFKVGSAVGSVPLTITVGQEAVVALGSDGISVHFVSRLGPTGNILCQGFFKLTDSAGNLRESVGTPWRSPSPATPLTANLRDISYTFTPVSASAPAPGPAPSPVPVPQSPGSSR